MFPIPFLIYVLIFLVPVAVFIFISRNRRDPQNSSSTNYFAFASNSTSTIDDYKNVVDDDPRRSTMVLCPKMDCVRCHHSNETRRRALKLFDQYYSETSEDYAKLFRIRQSLINFDNVRGKSDFDDENFDGDIDEDAKVNPNDYVFYMRNLRRRPIWNTYEDLPHSIALILDRIRCDYRKLFTDEYKRLEFYARAVATNSGESASSTEESWKIFSFMNQGDWTRSMETTRTAKVLRELSAMNGLMQECVFGNAFYSVLKPGASIEAHVGPTNVRIRAHLSIQSPTSAEHLDHVRCTLTVDDQFVHEWREQDDWFVFDDSFRHSVYYGYDTHRFSSTIDRSMQNRSGSSSSSLKDRCVLILDLWHPDLSREEIDCLKKIFPSRLNDSLW